ncbi:hypothetical protein SLW70_06085 [Flavobacterium sp. NG2]|uniref:hypothetical protein n=1 Tax=Flavobacterium sp. NG2 TaxID=3097547 RepID=UPI002A8345B0|nr:hypothetical protein [Flavobacterium sp. NG2]WPR72696.1 hypothetical protein SLW70_06085 [Flavobacterium sp. NG2]
MKTKNLLLGLALAAGLFISCDVKDKIADNTPLTADDVSTETKIDAAIEDVAFIAEDQYATQQASTAKPSVANPGNLPSCATVTTVVTSESYTRTVDFGTTGCTLANGNTIKGKIIISFSKDLSAPSKTLSYTLENFYHNGRLVQGNRTVELTKKATTHLNEVHPVSTLNIDMTVTFENGKIYTRKGTRTREIIEGYNTPQLTDNVLIVTGNHTTSYPNGTTITSTIDPRLRFLGNCVYHFPVSGKITIVKNNNQGVIDFGDGTCDNKATITIQGITVEYTLTK